MLPGIESYQWQIWLLGGILGLIVFTLMAFIGVLAWNYRKAADKLPEITGWFGFLLSVVGVVGLILNATYITMRIILLRPPTVSNYELLMISALGSTIVGFLSLEINGQGERGEIRWGFFEHRARLRNPTIGRISFLIFRAGILGLMVWAGWVVQELGLLNSDLSGLNHFSTALILSLVSTGVGQLFRIGGHDIYTMTITKKGWLILRFDFLQKEERRKRKR
jgi:hypothetical protein